MPKTVAMVLAKNFEDVEATSPKEHLESLGVTVVVVGVDGSDIEGKKGTMITPDVTLADLTPEIEASYDALIVPGGGSPENLRIVDEAVAFTRRFVESGKPVASICHGPQLLISAKVVDGRTITAVNKIRDDIVNAGGHYVDEEVVVDGNLISSRVPGDLPAFNRAIADAVRV